MFIHTHLPSAVKFPKPTSDCWGVDFGPTIPEAGEHTHQRSPLYNIGSPPTMSLCPLVQPSSFQTSPLPTKPGRPSAGRLCVGSVAHQRLTLGTDAGAIRLGTWNLLARNVRNRKLVDWSFFWSYSFSCSFCVSITRYIFYWVKQCI